MTQIPSMAVSDWASNKVVFKISSSSAHRRLVISSMLTIRQIG
ncbi:MAG: hypothetical protein Q7J98_08885 [Kiritimatiellia bacterium]|nr:hypothetical protein [Kiritimatiellia bacterium]